MSYEDALRFFVKDSEPKAIALKGGWGVGKTFYWKKKIIPEHFAVSSLRHKSVGYSYASLYGVESIQQLKNSLAFSYIENSKPGFFKGLIRLSLHKIRSVFRLADSYVGDDATLGLKGSSIKVKAKLLLNDVAFLSIRRSLICIDDIERRNKNLSVNDILGLVNYLVDQRECRVITILNYDSLDEEDELAWEKGKDKTFTSEVSFTPSLAESIEIGLKGSEHQPWHAIVRKCLFRLEIKNVRVVARVRAFVQQLSTAIEVRAKAVQHEALDNILMTATLLCAAHASRGTGAPSMFDILDSPHLLGLGDDEESKKDLSKDEKDWKEKISNYFGLHFGDALDRAIAHSILDGYPRMDLLEPALDDWLKLFEVQKNGEKFSQAWRKYHDSFRNNEDEVFNAFSDAVPGILNTEGVHNIEPTGRIFRITGHPEAATKLFEDWINLRRSPERIRELDGREHFGHKVEDPEFLALITKAKAEVPVKKIPLEDALRELDSGAVSKENMASLAAASPPQILEVLVRIEDDWRTCMKTVVHRGLPGEVGDLARLKFLEALRLLSNQSPLNADRVINKIGEIDFAEELKDLPPY